MAKTKSAADKKLALAVAKADQNGHSRWSASTSDRWIHCAGSLNAIDALPDVIKNQPQSIFAAEGTAAHHLADLCLKNAQPTSDYVGWWISVNKHGDCEMTKDEPPDEPEDDVSWHEVDDEMVEGVQLYLDTLYSDLAEMPGAQLTSEAKADVSWLHPGMYGRRDARIAEPYGLLRIYDLKYGKGVPVDVEDNSQEKYYALEDVKFGDYEAVELVVVQPRLVLDGDSPPGVRRWRTTPDVLLEWAYEVLLPAVEATKDPDAPRTAGDHCFWCLKGPSCEEKLAYIQQQASIDFDDPEEEEVVRKKLEDVDVLERSYKALKLMDGHAKMTNLTVDLLLRSGHSLEFAKLVKKRSKRRFVDEDDDDFVAALLKEMKEQGLKLKLKKADLFTAPKRKSPRQVELIDKRLKPVVAVLADTPDTGLTVADINDPREAQEYDPGRDFAEED